MLSHSDLSVWDASENRQINKQTERERYTDYTAANFTAQLTATRTDGSTFDVL